MRGELTRQHPNPDPDPDQVRDELKRQHLDDATVLPGGMPNMPSALLLTVRTHAHRPPTPLHSYPQP